MTIRSLFALSALVLAACNGEEVTDTDIDTEADTEAPNTFNGTFTYSETFTPVGEDAPTETCSTDFSVTGEEYVGSCNGCDWALSASATETGGDCEEPDAFLTLGGGEFEGALGYYDSYGDGAYTDVGVLGYFYDGYPYLIGQNTYEILTATTADGSFGIGSLSTSGTTVDWGIDLEFEEADPNFLDTDCTTTLVTENIEEALASTVASSTLPCDGSAIDVWETTLAEGDAVSFSVDTVAADSAFDSGAWVNDPDDCSYFNATGGQFPELDDSFECTFAPTNFECTGGTFTAPAAGTYEIVVANLGSCTDTSEEPTGAYTFAFTGGTATLVADDTDAETITGTRTINVLGTGTVDREL